MDFEKAGSILTTHCLFPLIADIVHVELKKKTTDQSPVAATVRHPQPPERCNIMAGKAKRAAARQGELGRRRKKGQRGPNGIPVAASRPSPQASNGAGATLAIGATGVASAGTAVAEPTQPAPVAAAAPQPSIPTRPQARLRGERPAAYNYMGTELRRIGVLATVAVAALVGLSFVL